MISMKDWVKSHFAQLIALCVGAGLVPSPSNAAAECTNRVISTLLSPDDSWIAVVRETFCSNESLAMSSTGDAVELIRSGAELPMNIQQGIEPIKSNTVLGIDRGSWEDRPITRWLSPNKMQITVPNKSLISLRKSNFEGIEIAIRFDPDDPSERERWLKSLDLPTK
jgi:hypothetical protein